MSETSAPTPLSSRDRPAAQVDRRPAQRRRRTAAGLPRRRRAGPPVRRAPATSCTWSAVRCATRCSAGSATTSTSAPTPTRTRRCAVRQGLGRGDLGDRARVRHDRRPARRPAAGDHHVPGRGVRRGDPQPGGAVRHEPARRPAAPRLHHQRDGGQPARTPVHRPVRRARRPGRPGDPYAGHAASSRSATIRCGCCGRPGSPRSCASPCDPAVRAAMVAMAGRPRPDHRRADPRRVHQAALRRRPGHRAAAAGRHRAGRPVPARSCPG